MAKNYKQEILERHTDRFLFKKHINIKKYLNTTDFNTLELLKIDMNDELYTESDFNFLKFQIYEYYDFNALERKKKKTKYEKKILYEHLLFRDELDKAIQKGYISKLPKSLNNTGATKKQYEELLKKIEKIEYSIYIDNLIYKIFVHNRVKK